MGLSLEAAMSQSYNSHSQLTARLKALTAKHAAITSVKSIGKSAGGRDLWALTLSKGNASQKTGILVVAGIDGTHLAGTEIAVQMAEKMLANAGTDSVAKLLETKTFYFVPSVNPDAQAQYDAKPRYERNGNDTATDDDRDGRTNEDPAEDLNGDGIISQLRIENPTGTFVVSKDDSRLMVKADPTKGEVGKYIVVTEGFDNDKDGQFNEDGAGGVNIDRNFSFDYPIFVLGSGEHAASETEVRALMDFVFQNKNIHSILTFGPANNLTEAPKFDPTRALKKIPTSALAKDAGAGEQIGKLYNDKTGLKDAPALPQTRGNFAQTAYYHAGRYSFTTPGWWVPKTEAPKDTAKKAPDAAKSTAAPAGARGVMPPMPPARPTGDDDLKLLKWADGQKLTDVAIKWTDVKVADYPNQKAEVGGIAPFAKLNPPVAMLSETADKHVVFLSALANQMPDLQIVNIKTEALGAGLTRVLATIVNKGLLPTYAEMGDRITFVEKVKVAVKLGTGQQIVAGKRLNLRSTMTAGEALEFVWLISGTGKVTLEAGCATTGKKTIEVTLK